ncbi:MAG: hypothetical protein DRQ89_02140 [Epsilonproteobacteria bacterium]|nr:MAG: hypothetical protein DRQ89_02140 [Campylobacterota bacterium]
MIETGGEALGYSLFLELERELKKGGWCYYRSNSKILDILNNYQENLGDHLNSPDVLKIIANTTNAGSLIKISLINRGDMTKIQMKIMGENGSDILFQDEKDLTSDRENNLALTAIDWLNEYSKKIPYDGRVIKISGEELVINVGENLGMTPGQYLKISRAVGKKKHPILDEVIWEKREIGTAEITSVRPFKATAKMTGYLSSEKPQIDDWGISGEKGQSEPIAPLAKKEQAPRYGYLSIALDFGGGSQTVDIYNFQNRFDGMLFGARLKGEVWLTENWWAGMDVAGRVGTLGSNNYLPDDNESRGYFKIKGGYRFLPTGFFSGPQIDILLGWGSYFYRPEYVEDYGPIDANFWGVLLGIKGVIPIGKYFRTSLYGDMLLSTTKDKNGPPGYFLELMFNYLFKSFLTFDASIAWWGNSWDNIAPSTDIRYKDFSLLLGATYYF